MEMYMDFSSREADIIMCVHFILILDGRDVILKRANHSVIDQETRKMHTQPVLLVCRVIRHDYCKLGVN
jgi:hypothetical protein